MMYRFSLATGIITAVLLTSCGGNSNLEKRVVELEQKVERLSKKVDGGSSAQQQGNNNPVRQQGSSGDNPLAQQAKQKANKESNQRPQGPTASISFNKSSHDFGTITAGEKVRHTFTFTNSSDVPLTINDASASCGCTVPSWPKKPVMPGQSDEIEVEFNSSGKSGIQRKTVTIKANTEPRTTKLNIKANVEKPEGQEGKDKKQE